MSENPNDPAGTTQQFRAFVNKGQPEGAKAGPGTGAIVALASVAALLALIVILFLFVL